MLAPAALVTANKLSAEISTPASAKMKAAYEMIASDIIYMVLFDLLTTPLRKSNTI